jgi:proteasome lid subunit RPN8/RPN11
MQTDLSANRNLWASRHPWVRGPIEITRAVFDAVEHEAVRGYALREEVCGYLVGPAAAGPLCDEHVAMPNLANKLHAVDPETYFRTASSFFAFNEKKFDDAVRAGQAAGRPVKVLYHSHLDVGAYFSPTDRAVLSMGEPPSGEDGPMKLGPGPGWPLAFLVASVRASGVDDHKMYVWQAGDFVHTDWTVVPG